MQIRFGVGISAFVLCLAAVAGVSCDHSSHDGTCETCKEPALATAPNFDHSRYFPLDGAHQAASCNACHPQGYGSGNTPKDCVGCHQKDYVSSPLPGHDKFPTSCSDCHTTVGWNPAMIPNHDQFFLLDGKHTTVACADCHTEGYAPGVTQESCVGCHDLDYETSPFPDHDHFGTACKSCHSTAAWQPATVPNHDHYFKLDGKHTTLRCASCHTRGYLVAAPKECIGCHEQDYDGSLYPGHDTFPTTCADCHTTSGWTPASGGQP